ncbi:MAG: cupin-like domain-containing protein [Sphingomonadaceae bacterium]
MSEQAVPPAIEGFEVNDDWRSWLAQNLSLQADRATLEQELVSRGLSPARAAAEVDQVLTSPYFIGAQRSLQQAQNRIRKYDWVLDIYRRLERMTPECQRIPRRSKLSGADFYREFYQQNRPVLITDMVDDWPAMHQWNHQYLKEHFGAAQVEVQASRSADPDYEINSVQHRHSMRFADFLDRIDAAGETNDVYMTANNGSVNRSALAGLWADIGRLPEYMDPESASDGFLWIGPQGTRTPFHHDLTNNFMVQVVGRKRILLVPAHDFPAMYNHFHCYSAVDGGALDVERFPLLRNANILECELGPGEILFLPVGWWHYVLSLTPSITVSMTNFQADNDFYSNYSTYQDL